MSGASDAGRAPGLVMALEAASALPNCLRRARAAGLRAESSALAEMAEDHAGTTAATLMLRRALDLDERADALLHEAEHPHAR